MVCANRRDEQVVRVARVGRAVDVQAGDVSQDRLEALRVLRPSAAPTAGLGAEDHRHADAATGHVAQLRGLVDDRVQADRDEVHVHDLRHRPQARHRRPHGRAEHAGLGDRRVDHAIGAEALLQSACDAVDPAAGADIDAE
jgi:hypothetical protein